MGVKVSKEDKQQKAINRRIESQIEKEQVETQNVIKLLLLGAGESGKSTILKQMRIVHDNGFTSEDYLQQRCVVYSNTTQSMGAILYAMRKLDIAYGNPAREADAKIVLDILEEGLDQEPFTERLKLGLLALWSDKGVQTCFERSAEYQLNDSAKYFLEKVEAISHSEYVPSQDDLLRIRVKTTGVVEVHFKIRAIMFRVFDVGGQRSERKKWIHCFDDVNAIIFIVAMSEYDQTLFEDEETNRMIESMNLFASICNSPWFLSTSMILFLNKKDLFEEKIKKSPITTAFPEYTVKFLLQIYSHMTCATDTEQVRFILNATLEMIIKQNMGDSGLN